MRNGFRNTPKKTRPIPIPALNSMENQLNVLYSGSSSSFPNLTFPYLENARKIANNSSALAVIR